MEQLYYFTGLIFIWILSFFGTLFIALFIIEKLIEIIAKKFNALIKILEYAYNRKEFKEYLKQKNKFYCQSNIEMNGKCNSQCLHCNEYYKPLEKKITLTHFYINIMLRTILENQRVILEALRDGTDTGWITSEIDKRIEATTKILNNENMDATRDRFCTTEFI